MKRIFITALITWMAINAMSQTNWTLVPPVSALENRRDVFVKEFEGDSMSVFFQGLLDGLQDESFGLPVWNGRALKKAEKEAPLFPCERACEFVAVPGDSAVLLKANRPVIVQGTISWDAWEDGFSVRKYRSIDVKVRVFVVEAFTQDTLHAFTMEQSIVRVADFEGQLMAFADMRASVLKLVSKAVAARLTWTYTKRPRTDVPLLRNTADAVDLVKE